VPRFRFPEPCQATDAATTPPWHSTAICKDCGVISIARHDLGAYVSNDGSHIFPLGVMEADLEAIEAAYPETFARWAAGDDPAVVLPEPERPDGSPASLVNALREEPASEGVYTAAEQAHVSRRAADRDLLGFEPAGKSKLGRTRLYRTVEKRRERARKAGMDPDTMGPAYRLPRRGETRRERVLKRQVAPLFEDGIVPDDLDLRPLARLETRWRL
jgi:hypothetical protein